MVQFSWFPFNTLSLKSCIHAWLVAGRLSDLYLIRTLINVSKWLPFYINFDLHFWVGRLEIHSTKIIRRRIRLVCLFFQLWSLTVVGMLCLSWLVIWFQNSSLYHFSMFHASHHISPVPATQDEVKFFFACFFLLKMSF